MSILKNYRLPGFVRPGADFPQTLFLALMLLLLLPATRLPAQAPGVPIERNASLNQDSALIEKARILRDAGKLLDKNRVFAMLDKPTPARISLPPQRNQPMPGREIARLARQALLHVGWYHLCMHCSRWHLNLAGGYAISDNGAVATCRHCIQSEKVQMREGYLIAIDSDGNVHPVTGILAANAASDIAIISTQPGVGVPLPLNDQTATGDTVYIYSDPMNISGYFSQGIINRFYWKNFLKNTNPSNLAGSAQLRINVSTDWAPGSSGAPLLDNCGNVVGHVAAIESMQESAQRQAQSKAAPGAVPPSGTPAPQSTPAQHDHAPMTYLTLHEAIPARNVLLLAKSMDGVN